MMEDGLRRYDSPPIIQRPISQPQATGYSTPRLGMSPQQISLALDTCSAPPWPITTPRTIIIQDAPAEERLIYPKRPGPVSGLIPVRNKHSMNTETKGKDQACIDVQAGKLARAGNQKETENMRDPEKIDYRDWYGNPLKPPQPWGWRTLPGTHTFEYNELGELKRKDFSRSELENYFYGQPINGQLGATWLERRILPGEKRVIRAGATGQGLHVKVRHGLTLWIGWTPSRSKARFPNNSNLCCFRGCTAPKGGFRVGQPRVAFDERMNVNGTYCNPFHVAGYMHLFCLEQQFDILKLMDDLDVRIDCRNLSFEEKNPFSFNVRNNPVACVDGVYQWLASEWGRYLDWQDYLSQTRQERRKQGKPLSKTQVMRPRHFNDSLTKNMVENDIINYFPSGKQSRTNRRRAAAAQNKGKPCDAESHLGNLEYYCKQMNYRKRKPCPSIVRSSEDELRRRDSVSLAHVVYNFAHFTEGFVPGEYGKSNRDYLGRPLGDRYVQIHDQKHPTPSFQAPSQRVPNQDVRVSLASPQYIAWRSTSYRHSDDTSQPIETPCVTPLDDHRKALPADIFKNPSAIALPPIYEASIPSPLKFARERPDIECDRTLSSYQPVTKRARIYRELPSVPVSAVLVQRRSPFNVSLEYNSLEQDALPVSPNRESMQGFIQDGHINPSLNSTGIHVGSFPKRGMGEHALDNESPSRKRPWIQLSAVADIEHKSSPNPTIQKGTPDLLVGHDLTNRAHTDPSIQVEENLPTAMLAAIYDENVAINLQDEINMDIGKFRQYAGSGTGYVDVNGPHNVELATAMYSPTDSNSTIMLPSHENIDLGLDDLLRDFEQDEPFDFLNLGHNQGLYGMGEMEREHVSFDLQEHGDTDNPNS